MRPSWRRWLTGLLRDAYLSPNPISISTAGCYKIGGLQRASYLLERKNIKNRKNSNLQRRTSMDRWGVVIMARRCGTTIDF